MPTTSTRSQNVRGIGGEGGKYRDPLEEIGEGNDVARPDLLGELRFDGGKAAAGEGLKTAATSSFCEGWGRMVELSSPSPPTHDLSPCCLSDRYYRAKSGR